MSLFTTYRIRDTERGLLYRDGVLSEWLEPGRHRRWGSEPRLELKVLSLDQMVLPYEARLARVAPAGAFEELYVPSSALALVTYDGQPTKVLPGGRWLLSQLKAPTKARLASLEPLRSEVPEAFAALVPAGYQAVVPVRPYEKALVTVDGVLREVAESGRAVYNAWARRVEATLVDLREQELQVLGQELMTADKVTLRLNLVVKYRVQDPVKAVQAVVKLQDALYAEAQMAARHFVAALTLDQLLERRADATVRMAEALRERAEAWGAEVLKLDLKDLVLPGEMKALLNKVTEAEKKAAAQVILRREEVAATRSLANTAKLLESSPVLLRLKELEAWKELAERIPNLTVVLGNGPLAERLGLPGLAPGRE